MPPRLHFSWLPVAALIATWTMSAPPAISEPAQAAAVAGEALAVATPSAAEKPASTPNIPACASDTKVLGLSRVVEIDAAGGPQFGGGESDRVHFLGDREVVLTFDDGPMRNHTRAVLAALAAQCTRATFFMLGRLAAADPAMVKEVMSQGHTVASHTWSHQNLSTLSQAAATREFEMGISAVSRAAGGAVAPFFRFPYLRESAAVLDRARKRNIATFWIDVDSKDFMTRDAQAAQRRVMAGLNAKGKGVILMHDIQPSTVGAIAPLLDELRRKGYKVVHLTPKAPASTVAEFDAAVAKAFADKSKELQSNPLADRSVVWPSQGGAEVTQAATGVGANAATSDEEQLPWLRPAAGNGAAMPEQPTSQTGATPSTRGSSGN